jgi:hypothetical protein
MVVRALYFIFRWTTGLRVSDIPAYREILREHNFELQATRELCGGLLAAELWKRSWQSRHW